MDVCCECCVLSGRGLCDELITPPEESYGCLSVVSVVCCQVEVSASSWSLVQRSPTDCGASLCVIKKRREWGGHGPRWAAAPQETKQNKIHSHTFCDWSYWQPTDSFSLSQILVLPCHNVCLEAFVETEFTEFFFLADSRVRMWRFYAVSVVNSVPIFRVC